MNINNQQPEQRILSPDGALQLHHVFPTIQGEGPFAGCPAIFVRLAGCNIQCPFCDTDYTSRREVIYPSELLFKVLEFTHTNRPLPLVVITGGEPFRQNLTLFVTLLLDMKFRVQIETNGTLYLDDFPFDRATVVCSPKTPKINADMAYRVHAFKYVVQAGRLDMNDGLPQSTLGAAHAVAKPPVGSKAQIFVQPLDEQDTKKNQANTDAAVQSCLRFGHRLCIQTHKLCNLE